MKLINWVHLLNSWSSIDVFIDSFRASQSLATTAGTADACYLPDSEVSGALQPRLSKHSVIGASGVPGVRRPRSDEHLQTVGPGWGLVQSDVVLYDLEQLRRLWNPTSLNLGPNRNVIELYLKRPRGYELSLYRVGDKEDHKAGIDLVRRQPLPEGGCRLSHHGEQVPATNHA